MKPLRSFRINSKRAGAEGDPRAGRARILSRTNGRGEAVDEAQKWRARAARYREFAELAMDGAARLKRMERARNFERLAAELEGSRAPVPARARPIVSGLRRTLSRVAGFWVTAT
jgi:hypothetical protein